MPTQRRPTKESPALGRLALGLVLAVGLSVVPARPSLAQSAGPEPAFAAALALWLDDDEETALVDLAGLARRGDAAARMLLGLIDKTPALQGPWLARLSRVERLALLRAPGGMSGRSWLGVDATHPLARAWDTLMRVDAGLSVAAELAAMGEARGAREALAVLAAREHPDLGDDWHDWMDPEVAYLIWPRAAETTRAAIAASIPADHPQWSLIGTASTAPDWESWLAMNPAAAPLRALCEQLCPDTASSCRRAAYAALGSHNAVLTLGSPAEALVAQDDFLASRRGRTTVLRRILLATDARGRTGLIQRARAGDACLGDAIEDEAARYRRIRESVPASEG